MYPVRSQAFLLLLTVALFVSCGSDSTSPEPLDPVDVGDINTWAGTGEAGYDGDGHDRAHTQFYWPNDIEFTPTLGAFVSDWNNHRIRRLDSNGKFETIIGTPSIGDGPPYPNVGGDIGDYVPGTECDLNHPTQVFERSDQMLVVMCWHNHKIRLWDPTTGEITVLIGRSWGCTGDGENVSSPTALINQAPHAVEGPDGSLYINDQRNQIIRKIDPSGILSTVAGMKVCDNEPGGYGGDNGPPANAVFSQPTGSNPNPPGGGLVFDDLGRLYIADTLNHRIRRIDFNANMITTVVGSGVQGFGGDGGDPLLASLDTPLDITFGPDGRLYIADTYNNRIRAVDFTANVITTVAGNGRKGFSGDRYPATEARLAWPYGIGFDADGHLYIADTYNHRIRRVLMHD